MQTGRSVLCRFYGRTAAVLALLVLGLGQPVLRAADDALAIAEKLQDAFTSVAEKTRASVVVISNKQNMPAPDMQQMPPELWRFFGVPPHGQGEEQPQRPGPHGRQDNPRPQVAGKGSGVILRADGYIVTNYHVIQDSAALEVRLEDGRTFDSERDAKEVVVVGYDEDTDLAVLRVGNGDVKDLHALPVADSDKIRVGDWAIAVGAPFNLDYSVTVGHVSQKGRYDLDMTTFENYIQTDASINPGNSGGPLLNIRGELIGINEFIVTGGGMSRGSVGIGFAIASNLVRQVADDLIKHGEVIRPFLGISMQPLDSGLKKQFGVEYGVLVSEAIPGDPADKAGIKAGDVITNIGDKPVRTPHDLLFAVLAYGPGDKITVRLVRKGETQTVEVVARQRGKKDNIATNIGGRQEMLDRLGLTIESTPDGVFVADVVSGSPADRSDLRRGDRIIEVNQIEIKGIGEVFDALKTTRGTTVVFYIDRRGNKRFVGVELESKKDKGKDKEQEK